jgi:hypothetical protein
MDAQKVHRDTRSALQVGRRARARLGALAVAVIGAGIGVVAGAIPAGATSIFQIEFRHCDTLHIGYKHFPAGTILHWSVNQHGRGVATGQFVTAPGTGMHFDSAKLPTPLDPHPKASVTFVATIDGHEFRMTAGRAAANPNKPLCVKPRVTPSGVPIPIPVRLTAAAPPTTTGPTSRPAPRVLAFTGNGPGALVGVGFLLLGAALVLVAQPTSRHARTQHRRRPAPWLYVTAVPPHADTTG